MKRLAAIFSVLIMVFFIGLDVASAQGFMVEKTSPKNGADGIPTENMGVKVFFNQEVYSDENAEANKKLCKIVDSDGKEIKTTTYFNEKDKKVVLVLVDSSEELKETTKYKLIVDKAFTSSEGGQLEKDIEVEFETINSKTNTMISMGMMAIMIVGMIYASSRAMKKEKEQDKKQAAKQEKFNPYKVAKETGKSLEEVLAEEKKRKDKEAAKAAKRKDDEDEDYFDYDEDEDFEEVKTYKVSSVSSAAAKGSKYVSKKRAEDKKRAEIEAKIKASKQGKGKGKKKK